VDDDRATQIDREVAQLLGRTHDAEDVGLLGPVHPEHRRVVVGEQHLVVVEELPRHGHRDGERRIVDRVQPVEDGAIVASEERVARPAKPDQPVREVDDRVIGDLDPSEARAVDVHCVGASLGD